MPLIKSLTLQPIRTDYWAKPGPTRAYDWSAVFDNLYDGAPDAGPQWVGYGATEREAIINLLEVSDDELLDSLDNLHAHPSHLSSDGIA